jgi:dienelactone hydrolase
MKEASSVNIEGMTNQAKEFLKLGFAVLVPERRGFGKSKEKLTEFAGDCDHHDQIASGKEASKDILGAIDYAQGYLDIDPTKIILVGHSAGGFVTMFATSYQHPGVRAAINIEGGRGFDGHKVCSKNSLLEAYSFAGQTSRIPTLWIYVENDHVFSKNLARSMLKAFTSKGGKAEFVMLPPFEAEGHGLFGSPAGVSTWLPPIKNFLKSMGLCPLCNWNSEYASISLFSLD